MRIRSMLITKVEIPVKVKEFLFFATENSIIQRSVISLSA